MNYSSIDKLLATLYAAPVRPEMWQLFLQQISEVLHVEQACLLTHDLNQEKHQPLGYFGDGLREATATYEHEYAQHDGWLGMLQSPGKVCLGHEYWPDKEMLKTAFYNEYLTRFGVRHMAAVVTLPCMGWSESLSVYRGPKESPFDDKASPGLAWLLPHLQSALFTRKKLLALETRVSSLENTLDQINCALLLIDTAGKTIFVSEEARKLLARGDGLFLSQSRLSAVSHNENRKLQELVTKAVATARRTGVYAGAAMSVSRSNGRPLHVTISPLHVAGSLILEKTAVVVFVTDPEIQPAIPAQILRTLFGLTSAEARVALNILEGNNLSETADLNRVGRETVKSQLAVVFSKTGTKRQGELVRLLSRIPSLSTSEFKGLAAK